MIIFAPRSPKTNCPDMDNHNLSPRGEYGRERLQGGLGFDGLDKHAGVVAKRLRMSIIMRKYLTIGLTLTLILGSDVRTFARQSGLLNQQQVISHLVAQSLLGEYPNGRQWSERFHHDGSTTYREGETRSKLLRLLRFKKS